MKIFLLILILATGKINAMEFKGKVLKCESIKQDEKFLKCDNDEFYQREQKSYNEPNVVSDKSINDSKIFKEIEDTRQSVPSSSSGSNSISK